MPQEMPAGFGKIWVLVDNVGWLGKKPALALEERLKSLAQSPLQQRAKTIGPGKPRATMADSKPPPAAIRR